MFAPAYQLSHLTSLQCLVVIADEVNNSGVISKFDDEVGSRLCWTVMGEQCEQQWTGHTPLGAPVLSLMVPGDLLLMYINCGLLVRKCSIQLQVWVFKINEQNSNISATVTSLTQEWWRSSWSSQGKRPGSAGCWICLSGHLLVGLLSHWDLFLGCCLGRSFMWINSGKCSPHISCSQPELLLTWGCCGCVLFRASNRA